MEFILGEVSAPYFAYGKEKRDEVLAAVEEKKKTAKADKQLQPGTQMVRPPSGSDSEYHLTLQILSTSSEIAADDERKKMLELGYPAYIEERNLGDRGIWYRVRVGGFKNHAEAKLVGDAIESALRKDYWIDEGKPPLIELTQIANRDVDGDGHPETVVVDTAGREIYVFTIRSGRYQLRWKGNNLQGVSYRSRTVYQDINSDGRMEAITQLSYPAGKRSIIQWNSGNFEETIR